MRKKKLVARLTIAVAFVALWGAVIVLFFPKNQWVSRIGVPRDFGDVKFFTEAETSIPIGLAALRSDEVKRELPDEKLSFIWEEPKAARQRAEIIGRVPPRYPDDENQIVTLPGGWTVKLGWAVMGYDPSLGNFPVKQSFTPTKVTVRGDTWESLDDAALHQYQKNVLKLPGGIDSYLPSWGPGQSSLYFQFLHEGLPDFRTVGLVHLMNLDTRTLVRKYSGGSFNSHEPGQFHTIPATRVFYPARYAVGFDVAYGPVEKVRLPAVPESRGSLPDLEIELIAIERLSTSGTANSFPLKETGNRETRAISYSLNPESKPRTHLVFSLSAPELGRFCDIVLVNRKGEEEVIKLDSTYTLTSVSTETLPDDLTELILFYRPHQARLIFELPPLCGMPEKNREIDNLFDVTFPHLTAWGEFELRDAVASQASIGFALDRAKFPDNHFPRHYENVTVREPLEEYLAHHPEGSRVQLDPKTHYLSIPEPFSLKASWKKVRTWAGI